jgi:hypothetical protein
MKRLSLFFQRDKNYARDELHDESESADKLISHGKSFM